MVSLVGGTVADVYTGTYVEANVVIDEGRILYVGPREPAGETIDVGGKVLVPGYIEPHAHPWCLYSPSSLLEVAIPDGTTTLVYDNLFFFLGADYQRARQTKQTDPNRIEPSVVAALATLFFATIKLEDGGPVAAAIAGRHVAAAEHTLLASLVLIAVAFAIGFLLPKKAREMGH